MCELASSGLYNLSKRKAKISSMNGLNVTDSMSDWSNYSMEYRMSAFSVYILFLQLSLISIFVTYKWLLEVAWSRDMIRDTIRILRHGLSRLRVKTRSKLRHETDKVSNSMGRERSDTQNKLDRKYMRQGTRNKAEMHTNETRDGAEMDSLAGTIWLHFQQLVDHQ